MVALAAAVPTADFAAPLDLTPWPRIAKARSFARGIAETVAGQRAVLDDTVTHRAVIAAELAGGTLTPELRTALSGADAALAREEAAQRRALVESERDLASAHYALVPRDIERSDWSPEARARQRLRDAERARESADSRRRDHYSLRARAQRDTAQPADGDMGAAAAARETLARLETELPTADFAYEAADRALADARRDLATMHERVGGLIYRLQRETDPEIALAELLPLLTVRRG